MAALFKNLLSSFMKKDDDYMKNLDLNDVDAIVEVENAARQEELRALADEEEVLKREEEVLELEEKASQSRKDAEDANAIALKEEAEAEEADKIAKENLEACAKAEKEAREKESVFIEKENAAKSKEEELTQLEEKIKLNLLDIETKEKQYEDRLNELQKLADGEGASGLVAQQKAANELAQLKETDPTPLVEARLTNEALLRKQGPLLNAAKGARFEATQARKPFEAVTKKAEAARVASEQSNEDAKRERQEAVDARKTADAAKKKSEKDLATAKKSRTKITAERRKAVERREKATAKRKHLQQLRKNAEKGIVNKRGSVKGLPEE